MPKETTQVMNVWNQPIYLNLPGGRSLKIGTRETAEVEEGDLNSPAMIFHRSRGNILVLEAQAQQEAEPEQPPPPHPPPAQPQPPPPQPAPPQPQAVAAPPQPTETAKPAEERPHREREHKTGKKGEQ